MNDEEKGMNPFSKMTAADVEWHNQKVRVGSIVSKIKRNPNMPKMRSNRKNDGREFQREIANTASAYRSLGVLKIVKVDPPVRMFGTGNARKIIFTENELPDFVGVHCPTKRMLAIEAKSTATHLLSLNRDGGITEKQCALLKDWARHGAIVGVLWRFGNACEWWRWAYVENRIVAGDKSLKFGSGQAVMRGNGFVYWHFAPFLA